MTAALGVAFVSLPPASSRAEIEMQSKGGVISFSNTPSKASQAFQSNTPSAGTASAPQAISSDRVGRFDVYIREAAALYRIPEELVRAVMKVESGFDPHAVSHANARGLMQLIPQTAERMMVTDIFDPRQNIFGGVRYLRVLANLFNGDLTLTIAAYNAGEAAVIRYGGVPPFPETQDYVVKVISNYRYFQAQGRK